MKKRVRIYKSQSSMPNVQLNKPGRSLKRAQAGIEQQGMEQQGMSQQQLNPQQMQQQVMQMIEQALIQGADPRVIYSKLAKQLQGQIDPKMLNQMVSVVVDKINESMVLDPQDDVAAMQETMQEPQGNGMQMPSQNQMMTNQTVSYTHLTLPTTPYV